MSALDQGMGEEQLATGPALQAYYDGLITSGDYPADPYTREMVKLLADRLGEGGRTFIGFVLAQETLLLDCTTGVNQETEEPMPRAVTSMPPQMQAVISLTFDMLARGAYGDAFADDVSRMQKEIRREQAQRPQAW